MMKCPTMWCVSVLKGVWLMVAPFVEELTNIINITIRAGIQFLNDFTNVFYHLGQQSRCLLFILNSILFVDLYFC